MIRHYVTLDNTKQTFVDLETADKEIAEMIALEAFNSYHHAECIGTVNLDTTFYKMQAAKEAYEYVKAHEDDERIIMKAKAQYKVLLWQWTIELTEKTADEDKLADSRKWLHKWQVKLAQCQ